MKVPQVKDTMKTWLNGGISFTSLMVTLNALGGDDENLIIVNRNGEQVYPPPLDENTSTVQ